MDSSSAEYQKRLRDEVNVYREALVVHDLPDIYHYWSETYLRPKLAAAGFAGIEAFFTGPLAAMCVRRADRPARFVSIGAGNCDMEVDWAQRLVDAGHRNFTLECLDLNPAMLQRGRSAAEEKGLSDHIVPLEADFNHWTPRGEYDAVVANQALHHVVNLEGLFTAIRGSLRPDGCFVVSDMIGRNGHLRWPEALALIHEYWRRLPLSHRFNWQMRRYEPMFEDFDCSQEGFEGIRAQDILPLLLEHFHFDRFLAFGNLIDPFVDRSFGHNFDAADPWDRAFIDEVHARDETGIRRGVLTPTHLFAVLDTQFDAPAAYLDPPDPAACVRRGPAEDAPLPVDEAVAEDRVGRILLALERERRELKEAVIRKSAEVERVHQDLIERTHWAWDLEKRLKEKSTLAGRVLAAMRRG